jgi:hypothetical protein
MAYLAIALGFVSLALLPGLSQVQWLLFSFAWIEAVAGAVHMWLPVDAVIGRAGRKETHRLRRLELWRAGSDFFVRVSVWVGAAFVVLDMLDRKDLASSWVQYVILGALVGLGILHGRWRHKCDVDIAWARYPI